MITYIDDITGTTSERACTLISSSGAELTGVFVAKKGRIYKATRKTLVLSSVAKFYKL